MRRAGGRHGVRQPVGSAVFQPMTGGTRQGIVTGEAYILEQPFSQGHLGGIFRHVERQRHQWFL